MLQAARVSTREALEEILAQRIMILDGSMGALLYSRDLQEEDYRGSKFARHPVNLKNCTEALVLSRPGIVAAALFVFVPSIGMFAIADLMGGRRVPLAGNVIEEQFGSARNWPFGAALGTVLLVLFLGLLAWALRGDGEEALHK